MDLDEFTLADRLKEQLLTSIEKTMEEADISQGEVARRVGVLRRNVNQIMGRKKNASLDYILKMAESIGLDVEMRVKKPRA
ncbi:MAG: XRE family transcriptional regulator [Bdellovibrionaceae bacterium]|nr:XRE family transcriptional regulator [Pseudobdellovibrionaceae bacterium]